LVGDNDNAQEDEMPGLLELTDGDSDEDDFFGFGDILAAHGPIPGLPGFAQNPPLVIGGSATGSEDRPPAIIIDSRRVFKQVPVAPLGQAWVASSAAAAVASAGRMVTNTSDVPPLAAAIAGPLTAEAEEGVPSPSSSAAEVAVVADG